MAQIAQREGVGALFAGLGPRLAKVAPSCAIMIASYEMGKTFFRQRAVESGRT
jgi:solute carrier family 25 protein 39/40